MALKIFGAVWELSFECYQETKMLFKVQHKARSHSLLSVQPQNPCRVGS